MATHYSSGQYEDAYCPRNLQTWGLPKVFKKHPSAREGYTQFIANDKGHLLPSIPRSKASPWGTYMNTWEMPLKIPPAQVNLTSRSVDAAARLTEWVNKSAALTTACNGFSPEIIGKPSNPVARISKDSSAKRGRPASRGSGRSSLAEKMPAQEGTPHGVAATPKGPLSRQPGAMDVRMKEDASPEVQDPQCQEPKESQRSGSEVPLSRQPGSMDVRLKEAPSPKVPPPSRPASRDLASPRRSNSAEAPASGRPRSLETRPKGVSTPELRASCRPGSMEANPAKAFAPEALPSSRPVTKASQVLELRKTPLERDVNQSEKGGTAKPRLEESSN
uniref:Protein Flattop n=1 Tax=Pogona vitticeps TaxID=103695 RepID=A0A6J0TWR0_9SAUR